jgi:hypothetical protein
MDNVITFKPKAKKAEVKVLLPHLTTFVGKVFDCILAVNINAPFAKIEAFPFNMLGEPANSNSWR